MENYSPMPLELGIRHIKGEENLRVDKKLISISFQAFVRTKEIVQRKMIGSFVTRVEFTQTI